MLQRLTQSELAELAGVEKGFRKSVEDAAAAGNIEPGPLALSESAIENLRNCEPVVLHQAGVSDATQDAAIDEAKRQIDNVRAAIEHGQDAFLLLIKLRAFLFLAQISRFVFGDRTAKWIAQKLAQSIH